MDDGRWTWMLEKKWIIEGNRQWKEELDDGRRIWIMERRNGMRKEEMN